MNDPREHAVLPSDPPPPRHLLAAPYEPECWCPGCNEGLYFVEGVSGPERWRHVRTNDHRCHPVCAVCGAPATVREGSQSVSGDGTPRFATLRYLCNTHAHEMFHIDHL